MEKVRFGVPSGDDLPTHDAGAGAEEHDHAPVSVGARYTTPRSTRQPLASPGNSAAEGAESLIAPATRKRAASR